MLVIRFLRVGKKNQPSFYIVVTEKERGPKAGRFIEKVGFYNPVTKERGVDAERVKYWLSVGAKPSDTVWNLLVTEKVVEGNKIPVHARGEEKKEAETPEGTAEQKIASEPRREAPVEDKAAPEGQITEEVPKESGEEGPKREEQGAENVAEGKTEEEKEEKPAEDKQDAAQRT